MSAKHCQDPCSCSGPLVESTNKWKCILNFLSYRQINNGFFKRPIMAHTQILVQWWGPEQGFWCCFADSVVSQLCWFNSCLVFRVNCLIHNFLQRDATTRSLYQQPIDLSSKGSLHVMKTSDVNVAQNNAEPLQSVLEISDEGGRRHSSGMTLEPLDKGLKDVRSSLASLSVPENFRTARRYSGDSIEAIDISQHYGPEICLEIPQSAGKEGKRTSLVCDGNITVQASKSEREQKTGGNVNQLASASLSPTLGAVHIIRPLAGIAWTRDDANVRAKSGSFLRSTLSLKKLSTGEIGSKSAPSSPVTRKSTKF